MSAGDGGYPVGSGNWLFEDSRFVQWQKDYLELVNGKLSAAWTRAMLEAAENMKLRYPKFLYAPLITQAQEYIQRHGAVFVTNAVREQKDAISALIGRAASFDALSPDELSRSIRPLIGLTWQQSVANFNYYQSIFENLRTDAGLSKAEAYRRASESSLKLAARQHRYRAMNIARTELAFVYNHGAYAAVKEAQEQGYLGGCYKVWLTADDERVCPVCGGLDGKSLGLEQPFDFPIKRPPYPEFHLTPPAHPSCRCAVAYEEIDADGNIPFKTDTGAFEWLDGLPPEEKVSFLGGKTKAALYDAGMLDRGDYFKPLKEIDTSGIIMPGKAAMGHSIAGHYKNPSKGRPGGRLAEGGHTSAAMREMDKRGILYNIVKTEANGVRLGNAPDHRESFKRSGLGQTWFPESWTRHDIMSAGIYTANKGNIIDSLRKEAVFKNINIRIMLDNHGRIVSVFPSYDQEASK